MKKLLISILLFISFLIPGYSSEKIVYLDVEKIMQDSIAGKSIISQLKKKREISIIWFLINIEITINNKDTITKTSKLIRAVKEIIERNNMLNPLLGLVLFLI